MTIENLDPQIVWKNFYALTQIPRPSKKEGKAVEFMYNFGKSLGLETIKDEIGNVIIRKPATPGMENVKGVVLQGHVDMVPQKNADTVHDFENDPIQTWIDGDWVKAKGTTLGADDGLGVAIGMAVLESKDIKHGPIELLCTVDEETGMTGAFALQSGLLQGDILINLDSETEGELYVGCAGGCDTTLTGSYEPEDVPAGFKAFKLAVKGFKGGHSGMDIILGRANANRIMARVLYKLLLNDVEYRLGSFEGGTLRNAIPREAFATIYVPEAKVEALQTVVAQSFAEVKTEFATTDPDANYVLEATEADGKCMDVLTAAKYVSAILACPDGVERMSADIPGLCETSNNLAVVKIAGGETHIQTLIRSSVDTAKRALRDRIDAALSFTGAESIEFTGEYSGWAPNTDSEILNLMKDTYKNLFGNEPEVKAIHAGLECGILGSKYPNWDMISCGPTLMSPHSPDERALIPTVAKVWTFIKAVLENIPTK